jgi:acyl-CoA thioester hydrolase
MLDWDHPQPFVVSIDVSAADTDELGHVNNATYVRWMEQCAWRHSEYLHLSMDDYRRLDRAMVVLRHEIDYLAAAFSGECLKVATWIVKTDGKLRLTRHFQIIRPRDGQTLLRAESSFVCMELSSGRARRMPDEFISGYGAAVISEKEVL